MSEISAAALSTVTIRYDAGRSYAVVDGVDYVMIYDLRESRTTRLGGFELHFEGFRLVNKCEHCGRFDTAPNVAHSWQEAIDNGWLIRADDPRVAHLLT